MKNTLLLVLLLACTTVLKAQIPYYAPTVGNQKINAYTSVKCRPGINQQETYTTFQYGLGDHVAVGGDLYTALNSSYWGALLRYGTTLAPWLGVGGQLTPSFNLNNSFRFAYLTTALYLNGALTRDRRLFWCSNTFWVLDDEAPDSYVNYEYLGYNVPCGRGTTLTPMVGALHSWRFDQDVSLAAGCYLTRGPWCFYLWGNDFLQSHPRLVVGVEFTLSTNN